MSDDLTIAYMLGVEDMRSRLHKQADQIERLRAENEKLREALKPFAAIDTLFCDSDEMEFELWLLVKADGTIDRPTIKVGDLRAARKALGGTDE